MRLEVHVLSPTRKLLLFTVLAVLPLVAAACGGGGDGDDDVPDAPVAPTVDVILEDGAGGAAWRIRYQGAANEQPQVSAGEIRFDAAIRGALQHEFVIYRTDLAALDLPLVEGLVDQSSPDITVVLRIDTFEASRLESVVLEAGHYVLLCNLPGHYELGMSTNFTVDP